MNLLFLTILFPLLGYLFLAFARERVSENVAAAVGVGSIGLSALTTIWIGVDFFQHTPSNGMYTQVLWTWMQVGSFAPQFALHLDGLSLTMLGVVTGVGFFIHLFASWYMRGEEGYERFFSYMNLFVMSMLFLVLADNLVLLYLGWEGVGLCSFLLIGFYYKNPANGYAARKSFVITRVGDVFMAIGLFILFKELGTLHIQDILVKLQQGFTHGDPTLSIAALLLLGGAVGKSAQLPLQTWLPDAMAGPTPVSALIHAATMVTAGVYLIARMHTLFEMSPDVLNLVGWIGALTLLMAGLCALVQTDIKRILAYSTMSQIGYMFMALGAGAWGASVYHLMTHAFFKALLFLSAGAVIIATHHEQDIFKMGGLRKKLPLVYICFLVGGAALAAFPFITAGFYSKDEILWLAYANGHPEFFYMGLAGAFLTSLYTFRLIFVAFHGKAKTDAHAGHGISHVLPLLVLLILSTAIGALIHPPLANVLPEVVIKVPESEKHFIEYLSMGVALSGILLAAILYSGKRELVGKIAQLPLARGITVWWKNAFGFDFLYDWIFVKPFMLKVRILARDWFDALIGLLPWSTQQANKLLVLTQNGQLRWYLASMLMGLVVLLVTVLWHYAPM